MPDDDSDFDAALRRGADLFNAGDYFAAHEVWEALWRFGPPAERTWVHSLIQAAVALYHSQRGNLGGARRQVARGRRKAALAPPAPRGLDLAHLWDAVEACVESPPGAASAPLLFPRGGRSEP